MKVRKEGYWVFFIITVFAVLMAIMTVLPAESASKICYLGYKAHCTFTPFSTVICLLLAGVSCFIRKRFFVTYK